MYVCIYIYITIILINFVTATISLVLNAGDLPDHQALPQPWSIKNKTEHRENIELDNDNNNNNN